MSMVKLFAAFVAGWCVCVIVAAWRNRVNRTPTEVYTLSGKRRR